MPIDVTSITGGMGINKGKGSGEVKRRHLSFSFASCTVPAPPYPHIVKNAPIILFIGAIVAYMIGRQAILHRNKANIKKVLTEKISVAG